MLQAIGALIVGAGLLGYASPLGATTTSLLHDSWRMQSSCKATDAGSKISSATYQPEGWLPVSVPNTIVAAQIAAGVYKSIDVGMRLRDLPGMDYPLGGNFSNLAMLDSSPYKCGWWYRTQFRTPAGFAGRSIALHLDGVNYRADVWLNRKLIASQQDVVGMWRVFEFNITDDVRGGEENTLAIEVFPPTENDLANTWVDWNPMPPDKNAGLFRDVYLTASGPAVLRFPFVASQLDANFTTARLTAMVEAWNTTSHPISVSIAWDIEGKRIQQQVTLAPKEQRSVTFGPAQFPELIIRNPRLWWPYRLGSPELYQARVSATVNGKPSDAQDVHFGIRQVTSELNSNHLMFRINGKPVLIRGAGWASDMLLRYSSQRVATELRAVRDLGLNTVRLEGQLQPQEFYDLADRNGMFVMAGWTCCNMWERWNEWSPEQLQVAQSSERDQIRLLRNHPSMLVWLYGSDNPPPSNVEEMYLGVLKDESWPNPSLSSAADTVSLVSGPSGVKMTGPYDYVPPDYWLLDKDKHGGAYGFNTETSPGPAIPSLGSLQRFLPDDKLWPQNEVWRFHAGGERFQNITIYNKALEHRYGTPKDLPDFLRKAYAMDYEGERAMFEAYARNKFVSTGVVQWMLNNAWPSLIWHLYDYYLVPGGGYYGTKKASEEVHAIYSYDDRSVAVVSEDGANWNGVTVAARLYNLDAGEKWSQQATLNVTPDAAAVAFQVPEPPDLSTTYFLKLVATDAQGRILSDNFYWLSTKPDELDWAKTDDTVYTPQSAYADMTGLESLPVVSVEVHPHPQGGAAEKREDGYMWMPVSVANKNKAVAFMVHLRLLKATGEEVIPSMWYDNFISLMPGESRDIGVLYRPEAAGPGPMRTAVDGWNVTPGVQIVTLKADTR